jgi:hypothetical protein
VSASLQRRLFWSEVAVAAALGLTAVATAWATYRGTIVRDDVTEAQNQGNRVLNLGTSYLLHADRLLLRNETLFFEYERAFRSGNRAQAATDLALMRPELRKQVLWWRDQPPGKYPSPFVDPDPYYHPKYLIGGRQLRATSQRLFLESASIYTEANRFDLVGVVLAGSLFLLGVAAVVRELRFRLTLLTVGALVLVAATVALVWLGLRDVRFNCGKFALPNVEQVCD